jgi:conjugative transfer signal peptidase TraF
VKGLVIATGLGVVLAAFGLAFDPSERLIWNRTGSAAEGLYWRSDEPFANGEWVAVSAGSAHARWTMTHGYVGRDWPLVKQIAAVPGDTVCRIGALIYVNGDVRADTRNFDARGQELPSWSGCERLSTNQFFLLNPHPSSLDGRYLGTISGDDLDGVLHPLLTRHR